jgi:hypothetical protein
MKTRTARYDKLRRLLGQHRTAAFNLAQWQGIQQSPNEQWRGPAAFAAKIAQYEREIAAIEHEIANEMRARLGVPSGTLTIRKEAA